MTCSCHAAITGVHANGCEARVEILPFVLDDVPVDWVPLRERLIAIAREADDVRFERDALRARLHAIETVAGDCGLQFAQRLDRVYEIACGAAPRKAER